MSLFAATLVSGLILVALGMPLLADHAALKAAIRAFPRSTSAGYVVFSAGAGWFLYNIWNLSKADFGEYRTILFIGFAAVAVLAFKCVPDFLGVRGACALVLIGAAPFLDSAFMVYDRPLRLFMVAFVYAALTLAIWLGAQPWRLRDFFNWLFARTARSRGLGGFLVAYGFLLCGVAFALR
jgi:hypothetical protein